MGRMHRAGNLLRQNDEQAGCVCSYYGERRKGLEIPKALEARSLQKRGKSSHLHNEARAPVHSGEQCEEVVLNPEAQASFFMPCSPQKKPH